MNEGGYKPGEAYAQAALAVKAGDFLKARMLKPWMEPSDARIIERRIREKELENERNGTA